RRERRAQLRSRQPDARTLVAHAVERDRRSDGHERDADGQLVREWLDCADRVAELVDDVRVLDAAYRYRACKPACKRCNPAAYGADRRTWWRIERGGDLHSEQSETGAHGADTGECDCGRSAADAHDRRNLI